MQLTPVPYTKPKKKKLKTSKIKHIGTIILSEVQKRLSQRGSLFKRDTHAMLRISGALANTEVGIRDDGVMNIRVGSKTIQWHESKHKINFADPDFDPQYCIDHICELITYQEQAVADIIKKLGEISKNVEKGSYA